MASKSMKPSTPARPAPLTEEERAAKVAMFLQQKRESYALSILAGLVHNPSITLNEDPQEVVAWAVFGADVLLDNLYPKKEGAE
jgi:hypothetical protein